MNQLRTSLRTFAATHPVVTVAIALVIAYVVWQFATGTVDGVRQAIEDHKVAVLQREAAKAQEQAKQEQAKADAARSDRQTEDAIRDRTIKPELDRANQNLETARQSTRRAEQNYEASKHPVIDPDIRALHERNCAELRELYPNERIALCDP